MKSKVFKFVLPAFAFALAIVASFAFTPAHNAEDASTLRFYIQNSGCVEVTDPGCVLGTGPICTLSDGSTVVFGSLDNGTNCNLQLRKQ